MSKRIPVGRLLLVLLSPLVSQCSSDTVSSVAWVCSREGGRPGPDDTACGSGGRFVKGVCMEPRCDAGELPNNCCPGEFICTSGGECTVPVSRLRLCEADTQCQDGERCLSRPKISEESNVCGFPPIEHGTCPVGTVPFNVRCVSRLPCDGGCATGEVCNIDLDLCEPAPSSLTPTGCDQACGQYEMLVFSDPDAMLFAGCCEVSCHCERIPPITDGVWGKWSDLHVDESSLVVSSYSATYGDLVVSTHDKETGKVQDIEFVDGLPATGDIVGDPLGPREGRDAPGPDVGQYTSMAVHNELLHIVYYDVDNASLKLATWDRSQDVWLTSLVDSGDDAVSSEPGSVGRYPSLTIDASGKLHVSYYAHRLMDGGELVTGPMYARSTTPTPSGPGDWQLVFAERVSSCESFCDETTETCVLQGGSPACLPTRMDCAGTVACACDEACVEVAAQPACRTALPYDLRIPCDASCEAGEECVDDGAGGTMCASIRTDCAACTTEEVCIDVLGAGECRLSTPYSQVEGYPEGTGLFTSMVLFKNKPFIAYYDRLGRHLRGAYANFSTNAAITSFASGPIDCEEGSDIGHHTSMRVKGTGNSVHIAYQAEGAQTLRYFSSTNDPFAGVIETIDDGFRDNAVHRVGASASLTFDSSNIPYVVYADQTSNDLRLAYKAGFNWSHQPLLSDGAYGSFSRIALEQNTAYVTTFLRRVSPTGSDMSALVVELVDINTLP